MPGLLAWSAGLFVAGGAVWCLIGALTVPFMDTPAGRSTLVFSRSSDDRTFGAPPAEVLGSEKNVATLRSVLLPILAAFLVVAGLLVVAVAWFAWRHGHVWAYAALTATAVLVVPFWLLAAKPFLDAGTRIGLLDVPPFMWVTTALWLPAIVLGALEMRSRAAVP
jgi:hypothetical protein